MRILEPNYRRSRAFTLPEVLIASAIVGIMVMANMAAVYGTRVMAYKDVDRGVVSGFMQHYAELVKALPFDQVQPNLPLSGLYSGTDNTPRIAFPANGNWFSIGDTNYLTFHPGLLWITNRLPQMRVVIETTSSGAIAHDKHVLIEVKWNSPLLAGAQVDRRLDLFRVKDL